MSRRAFFALSRAPIQLDNGTAQDNGAVTTSTREGAVHPGLNARELTTLVCSVSRAGPLDVLSHHRARHRYRPQTVSNLPSGEYCISFILPLPRRALASSGRFHCIDSCVKLFSTVSAPVDKPLFAVSTAGPPVANPIFVNLVFD